MLSFKPTFSLSSFTFIKRLFSSSSLSAIRVVSSAYLRLLLFLPAILIPACASSSPAFLIDRVAQIECLMNYGQRFVTLYRGQGSRPSPWEKKCKKEKWLSGEALQRVVKRRQVKSKGEKERYKHLNAEFQRIARRDKKAFLNDQCKEIEEKQQNGKD